MSKYLQKKEEYRHAESWIEQMLPGSAYSPLPGNHRLKKRSAAMAAMILVGMSLLFIQLIRLHTEFGGSYVLQAEGNRFREIIEYAPRGTIYDRSGHVLAGNTVDFQVSVTPYLLSQEEDVDTTIAHVAGVIESTTDEIASSIAEHGEDSVLPLVLASRLSQTQALQLKSTLTDSGGFTVHDVPVRAYDARAGLAHVVGYVGRASEYDLDQDEAGDLLPTDYVGKTGLEASYDDRLRGINGFKKLEVDALGRPVRIIEDRAAVPGEDLHTSIDFSTQQALYESALEQMEKAESTKASAVAVDPRDGSVIAMVSLPTFDNNQFAKGIDQDSYQSLIDDPNQPLFNKVISGGYTTGSIIKPLVAAAALEEGVVNENTIIVDKGYIDINSIYGSSYRFRGWRLEGLGPMNVRSAIANSSNIFFYTVGGGHDGIRGLGEERLTEYFRAFGLGEMTGVNLPNESRGRVPDAEWKLETFDEQWYTGDSFNISIGQGDLLVSPLQITMAEAAIINNGTVYIPKIIKADEPIVQNELAISDEHFQIVREGMRQVLTDGTTCECTFSEVPVTVAGKSGTAETNTPDGKAPHAWFTAFAPYQDPEIVVTVLVEEGQSGSTFAAPVTAAGLASFFDEK